MANLTLSVPDGSVTRIQDAVCGQCNWKASSGLTKNQFLLQVLRDYLKSIVIRYEADQAETAARTAKQSEVETLIG